MSVSRRAAESEALAMLRRAEQELFSVRRLARRHCPSHLADPLMPTLDAAVAAMRQAIDAARREEDAG
jgi:hypothetical protein